ncbi:MAG: ComEC/Rec2 family competence protein, partial [Holophagales bacterium]|nr:ComEC/Rec2 family competence protein [Holophagales bacterium]
MRDTSTADACHLGQNRLPPSPAPARPALPWAGGAVAMAALGGGVPLSAAAALAFLFLVWAWLLRKRTRGAEERLRPWIRRVASGGAAFCAAMVLVGLRTWAWPAPDLAAVDPGRPVQLVVWVASHPEELDGRLRFLARARSWSQRRADSPASRGASSGGTAGLWVSLPAEAQVELGSRLRLRGYLSRSPATRNFRPAEPGPWRFHVESRRFVEVEAPPPRWMIPILELRRWARQRLETWRDQGAAALVSALLFGDRSSLPEPWLRAFRASGAAHLLAVSGLHVGLVGVVAAWLWGCLPSGPRPARRGRWLWVAAVLGLYLGMVGPRPSAVRATLMGWSMCAALLFERPPGSLQALSLAVLAMVLWQVEQVHDLGFRLSVAATFAILTLAPLLVRCWTSHGPLLSVLGPWLLGRGEREQPGPARPWMFGLAATLAAQAATLPLLLPITGT